MFVVGHIDWSENDLRLEKVEAKTWQEAVQKHSKYPWQDEAADDKPSLQNPEAFKQQCFDCDCMMSWIEV